MRMKAFFAGVMVALLCVVSGGAGTIARADVTVVSEVRVTGDLPASRTNQESEAKGDLSNLLNRAKTKFYKGNKTRTETAHSIVITDMTWDKEWTIDPQAKTYYVTNASTVDVGDAVKMEVIKTVVVPGKQTRKIAGMRAKNYQFALTIKTHLAEGVAKAEGLAEGEDTTINAQMPTMTITGEVWKTEALEYPGNPHPAFASSAVSSFSKAFGGGETFLDKLSDAKGVTVSSTISLVMVFPGGVNNPLPMRKFGKEVTQLSRTITTTVKSVSREPLSDDLFVIPADYKQVPPPAL